MTDAQLQPLFDLIREAVNSTEEDATICISAIALRMIAEEVAALKAYQSTLRTIVAAQAWDDGLWFITQSAPEAYVQQEIRKLHAAIESDSPPQPEVPA